MIFMQSKILVTHRSKMKCKISLLVIRFLSLPMKIAYMTKCFTNSNQIFRNLRTSSFKTFKLGLTPPTTIIISKTLKRSTNVRIARKVLITLSRKIKFVKNRFFLDLAYNVQVIQAYQTRQKATTSQERVQLEKVQ